MTERSRLILPNGKTAEVEAPKVISTTLDADGNKLIYDNDTGATIVFGTNGCIGFSDAHGTVMRTTPNGMIEFICDTVRFISKNHPVFIEYKPEQNEVQQA